MKYQNVTEGVFLSRPNRFIAKVMINGIEETVHVKNTGRCRELLIPGSRVWLERSNNPRRKTAYDLFGVYKEGLGLVNMDSQAPNRAVLEWLNRQSAAALSPEGLGEDRHSPNVSSPFHPITFIKPEYTYGKSRIDFYLEEMGTASPPAGRDPSPVRKCLMEVKGVTLEKNGIAYFPDAPTERGVKHIEELSSACGNGYECFLAFVIQMPGILEIRANDETHPAFGEALRRARKRGLRILALGCHMETDSIEICRWREVTRI